MTATQVQHRRDTNTNIMAATPAAGEMAWNTTTKRAHMGDGTTAGGIILPNSSDIQNSTMTYIAAGGTANAITLTVTPAISAYSTGQSFEFKAGANNTGSTTVAVSGLTAKTIKKRAGGVLADLQADDIINGGIYRIIYDGTYFQIETLNHSSGLISVSQGDLNTSIGSVSTTSASPGANLTLPGGEYGFYPQIRVTGAGSQERIEEGGLVKYNSSPSLVFSSNTYVSNIFLRSGVDGGNTITSSAQQRYITSSPPYDLGDGQVGGFLFSLVNSTGDIVATYIADAPPWAYNGPTDIRCKFKCPVTGKKFRQIMKSRSLEEIMDGAKIQYEMQEITQAIKNADMGLIPHPFGHVPPGHTVVMLDPMDDRLASLIEYQNAGGSDEIITALMSGKIYADNTPLSRRKGPSGVMQVGLRFRYSGRK